MSFHILTWILWVCLGFFTCQVYSISSRPANVCLHAENILELHLVVNFGEEILEENGCNSFQKVLNIWSVTRIYFP